MCTAVLGCKKVQNTEGRVAELSEVEDTELDGNTGAAGSSWEWLKGAGEKLSIPVKAVGTGVSDIVGAVGGTGGKLQEAGEELAAHDTAKFGA